jgi:hypothetical protein
MDAGINESGIRISTRITHGRFVAKSGKLRGMESGLWWARRSVLGLTLLSLCGAVPGNMADGACGFIV